MGGVIHAQEDNQGLNAGQVSSILLDVAPLTPLRATTPHRTYTFEVVDVVLENSEPAVLGLREVSRTDVDVNAMAREAINEAVIERLKQMQSEHGIEVPMHVLADISQLIFETERP